MYLIFSLVVVMLSMLFVSIDCRGILGLDLVGGPASLFKVLGALVVQLGAELSKGSLRLEGAWSSFGALPFCQIE